MATSARRPKKTRPVQAPKRRPAQRARPQPLLLGLAALGVIGLALTVAALRKGDVTPAGGKGLPATSDYHSLLVAPANPQRLLLGTHQGIYVSNDGGVRWEPSSLSGTDAMNLVRPSSTGSIVWVAGHDVLAQSTDGGKTWRDVRPTGLPSLDVHGFGSDPKNPRVLFAAIAGQGLYRSADGGTSFSLVTKAVGPAVMALAIFRDGRILAGDMRQGLMFSRDQGRTWRRQLAAGVLGIAVNPKDERRVIATGAGVLVSRDGGTSWRRTLKADTATGPVAWSSSDPQTAYVVGYDRTLYRSRDAGETWSVVS